jgi:hypothetical protein
LHSQVDAQPREMPILPRRMEGGLLIAFKCVSGVPVRSIPDFCRM